jgi:hypothetical protein
MLAFKRTFEISLLYTCAMSNSDKYLVIGRPSQNDYDSRCASAQTATNSPCGNMGTPCHSPVAPHDRKLGPRHNREKVREDIKDYVLLMLGAPTVKVELDEQGLDLCVDQALMIFEEYAGREFFDYYTFRTTPGKSVYKLPDDVGIVRNVFWKKNATYAFQANDLGGAIPVEYFYPGGAYSSIQGGLIDPIQPIWGRMGEWVLYKQYEQMFSRVSSQIGGWEWVSDTGHIKLYPTPCGAQHCIVHYLQKCKDWKQVNQAMQEGALCHAMIMLGHIRGKYQSPPGPGGGMQLDGEYMKQKGWELKEKWQEELINKFGDLGPGITMD